MALTHGLKNDASETHTQGETWFIEELGVKSKGQGWTVEQIMQGQLVVHMGKSKLVPVHYAICKNQFQVGLTLKMQENKAILAEYLRKFPYDLKVEKDFLKKKAPKICTN